MQFVFENVLRSGMRGFEDRPLPDDIDFDNISFEPAIPEQSDVSRMIDTFRQVESGGRFDVIGASGERGAFQILPSTWKQWSTEYGGKELEFTEETEEDVARWRIQKWIDEGKTPEQIASLWNSGRSDWEGRAGVNKYGVAYDVPAYVKKFMDVYGGQTTEIDRSTDIDFESTGPITMAMDREPGIWPAPEPEEKSWVSRAWEGTLKLIRDDEAEIIKSKNAYAMAETLGISRTEAYDNLDALSKVVGLRGQPTFQGLVEGLALGGVTVGLLANPLATIIGVGTFMGLAEIENALISLRPDEDYEFGAMRGLQELLPEDVSQRVKDLVWTVDMAWKVIVAGGIGKAVTPKLHRGLQSLYTKFVRDVSARYNLPKDFYISPEKIREFHGRGKEEVISRAESDMLKDLGLIRQQYVDALKQGVDVRIPAEKIITAVDKPWWATLKRIVRARPYKMEFVRRAGESTIKSHTELLDAPTRSVPKRPVKPIDTVPEYEFVSKKGHVYEEIDDKWYDSKGREVTNKFVIRAAEEGKTLVGEEEILDVQVDKALRKKPWHEGLAEDEVLGDGKVIKKDRLKIEPSVEEPKPVHGTDLDKLESILKGDLEAGSAIDFTKARGWASEYPVTVEVPGAKRGKYVAHNKYYESAEKAKVAKVTVDLEQLSDAAAADALALIDRLKKEYSEVEFDFTGIRPGKEALTKSNLAEYLERRYDISKKEASDMALEGLMDIDSGAVKNTYGYHKDFFKDIKDYGKYLDWLEKQAEPKVEVPVVELTRMKGRPLYHGSKAARATLKKEGIRLEGVEKQDPGDFGLGFYTTTNESMAKMYSASGQAIPVQGFPRNPLVIDFGRNRKEAWAKVGELSERYGEVVREKDTQKRMENARKWREGLLREGYDGVIARGYEGKGHNTVVFFKPEQVDFRLVPKEPIPNFDPEISPFRQDPELTRKELSLLPEYKKIDTPDQLLTRITNEINSELDGEFDASFARQLLSDLNSEIKLWTTGEEPPGGIFDDLSMEELGRMSELFNRLDEWAKRTDRLKIEPTEPDVTLGMGIPIQDLYDKLTTPKKTKVRLPEKLPKPSTGVKEEARELVRDRSAKLALTGYETSKFVNSVEQRTTEKQRECLPFVLEKTSVPEEFNRPDLQKVIKKDKEHLESVAKDIKEWFDLGWKKIKVHIPDLTTKQIKDYVTHLWDIPKHKRAEATAWFSTQNRFLERRFIPTYAEGIKRGYKPKVLDINEIIKVHDSVTNRAIANAEYVEALLKMKRDGVSLIERSKEAPMDWIEVDYSPLTRRIPLKKGEVKRKGEFVKESRVRVHPDLVRPLKVIFEERFDHPVVSAYEAINGILKKSKLSLQLFHHGALGETGISLIGLAKTLGIYLNPVKIYKALVHGELDVFAKEVIARDSIVHGVQYGATADIPINRIQGYLNDLARVSSDLPLANRLTSFMKDANSVWDKALWTYLHDTLKLYGYESLVGRMNPKLGAEATKKAKREIAQLVNDTFGGQNWDTLMMTPKEVQMLTWFLLSADWTVSTTRQALAPTGIGSVYKETKGLRRKMGWRFWARAGLYFGIGMNLLNVLYRNRDIEENPQYYEDKDYSFLDKTMFGNTQGKKTYLFIGRYEDGTERYVRWGKQFRDFFELFVNLIKKIGGKVSPILQLITEIATGHTLSGFKNDDIYGTKGLEKAKGIIKTIAKAPLPISILRYMREDMEFKPLDIMMQSSKGMSRYSSMEYFKKAIIEGDEEALRDTYVSTLRNNLPAYTLFTSALSWVEAEATASLSETIRDIEDARVSSYTAETVNERKRYGKILGRLNKEKADKSMGLKLFRAAAERARVYRVLELGEGSPRLP